MKIFSQINSTVFAIDEISDLILSYLYYGKEYFTKEILNKSINRQYLGDSIKTPLLKINVKNDILDYDIYYEFADRLPLLLLEWYDYIIQFNPPITGEQALLDYCRCIIDN